MASDPIKLTDVIQAGSSVVAALVAFVALYYSRNQVHAPNDTFIRPTKAGTSLKDLGWKFELYNVGPGIAYNVRVKALVMNDMVLDPVEDGPLKVWFGTEYESAKGKMELQPQETSTYEFKQRVMAMYFRQPFVIRWESISGKKHKDFWLFHQTTFGEERFTKLEFFGKQWVRLLRILQWLRSLFMTIKKKHRFKKYQSDNKQTS